MFRSSVRPMLTMVLGAGVALALTVSTLHSASPARAADAADAGLSAADKARLKKLDDGPKKIDVTSYPAEQKTAYTLFTKKCAKCHSIARPINSAYVLPSEWERYVKRMTFKPNSKISAADGKAIYHFLVYDAATRKAKSLHERLEGLSSEERAAEVEKIKAIDPAFKAE